MKTQTTTESSRRAVRTTFALAAVFMACGPSDEEHEAALPLVDCPEAGSVADAGSDATALPTSDASPVDASADADVGADASAEDAEDADAQAPDTATPRDPTIPTDADLALVRFNVDGTLDPTFGTNGVSILDLGIGYVSGTTAVRDTAWSVARDGQGRFIVFGGKKGSGVRVDLDRVVVRTTPTGALDPAFATGGVYTFNLANQDDQARGGLMQTSDGKIVATGFTSAPTGVGTQVANRVVLFRLYDPGTLDRTFGTNGVTVSAPFMPIDPVNTQWGTEEVQTLDRQSSGAYVTAGFGRPTSSGTYDLIALRYTALGALDSTWGTKGVFKVDIAGDNDRGRALAVLPDDRVLLVGSATPMANVANVDALATVARADGTIDPSFGGGGSKLYDFGYPDEAFYAAAVSPDKSVVAMAGYRAGGANDDATLVLMPLPLDAEAGSGTAKVVSLSTTDHDRFWSLAFAPSGQLYAAGFVADNGDTRIAVARFDGLGTQDASFGQGGFASVNVVPNGGAVETARGVVVQPDGKVVVIAEIDHF